MVKIGSTYDTIWITMTSLKDTIQRDLIIAKAMTLWSALKCQGSIKHVLYVPTSSLPFTDFVHAKVIARLTA